MTSARDRLHDSLKFLPFLAVKRGLGILSDAVMATNSEPCPLCESFAAPHMKGVVRHIGLVHSHEFAFRVTCGVGECTRTYMYTRFSSYKKHMYVKHRDVLGVSTRERSPDLTDSNLSSHSYEEEERPEPYIALL